MNEDQAHEHEMGCGCVMRRCQTLSRVPAMCGRCGMVVPFVGNFDWPTGRPVGASFAMTFECSCGWPTMVLARVVAA